MRRPAHVGRILRGLLCVGWMLGIAGASGCFGGSADSCQNDGDCFKGETCSEEGLCRSLDGGSSADTGADTGGDTGPPVDTDGGDVRDADDADDADGGDDTRADTGEDGGDGADTIGLPDGDDDGVPDGSDNCPVTANPSQRDADADDLGDACDETPFGSDVQIWLRADESSLETSAKNSRLRVDVWKNRAATGDVSDFVGDPNSELGARPEFVHPDGDRESADEKPAVRFNGKDTTLALADLEGALEVSEATLFFVLENRYDYGSNATPTHLVSGCRCDPGGGACDTQLMFGDTATSVRAEPTGGTPSFSVDSSMATTQWQVVSFELGDSTSQNCPHTTRAHVFRLHQSRTRTASHPPADVHCLGPERTLSWHLNQIGHRCDSGGRWLKADIAEVVVIGRMLGEAKRQRIEETLRARYDL